MIDVLFYFLKFKNQKSTWKWFYLSGDFRQSMVKLPFFLQNQVVKHKKYKLGFFLPILPKVRQAVSESGKSKNSCIKNNILRKSQNFILLKKVFFVCVWNRVGHAQNDLFNNSLRTFSLISKATFSTS